MPGDFSFAYSLLKHHACSSLVATCFDSEPSLLEKYPQAGPHVQDLVADDVSVVYGVDATKLGRADGGGKEIKKGGFDKIVFNFPHVGGLTKDVNRQVRHNQGTIAHSLSESFETCVILIRFTRACCRVPEGCNAPIDTNWLYHHHHLRRRPVRALVHPELGPTRRTKSRKEL